MKYIKIFSMTRIKCDTSLYLPASLRRVLLQKYPWCLKVSLSVELSEYESLRQKKVTPIVLNLFENIVDPDQMASDEAI